MKIYRLKKALAETDIVDICKHLDQGGLLIYPTETCYGVGVDATNAEAVSRLLEYKSRPVGKAISVAVFDPNQVWQIIQRNPQAENIVNNFLPGPVTLVAKSLGSVDKRLASETGNQGVRIPAHLPLLSLLKAYGKPITSTSANLSGQKTPYSAQELLVELPASKLAMIDAVIDAGTLPANPPSLVIDTTQTNKVYRPGILTPEDITNSEVIISNSVAETSRVAVKIVDQLNKLLDRTSKVLITLEGELGAGKTTLVAAIARELKVQKVVNSPSFTIVKEYDASIGNVNTTLYHADLWRLTEPTTLSELGIPILIDQRVQEAGSSIQAQVVFVEWSDKILAEDLDEIRLSAEIAWIKVIIFKLGESSRRFVLNSLV